MKLKYNNYDQFIEYLDGKFSFYWDISHSRSHDEWTVGVSPIDAHNGKFICLERDKSLYKALQKTVKLIKYLDSLDGRFLYLDELFKVIHYSKRNEIKIQ